MEHARVVFNKNTMKLVTHAISNGRIRATNEYLKKYVGLSMDHFEMAQIPT
jgi:hypothetical protein